jgi:hypothetical protein
MKNDVFWDVALVGIDVSGERNASIIMVAKSAS